MKNDLNGPSPAREIQVRHAQDARVLMAGEEKAMMYFWTDRLVFSMSEIPPGAGSSRDPGHDGADEVCYVFKGTLILEFPGLDRKEKLEPGDAILIPEKEPHIVFNPGTETAVSAWATAPQLGYEIEELTGGTADG
jgi:mannose-6-phosphate isomerase-like protein (cupin superfamily)